MIAEIGSILQDMCRLSKEDLMVIGVSGGLDSLSLAHILHTLDYQIVIAHFNHQLRDEAEQDSIKTRDFAEEIGVEFELGKEDVQAYSQSHSLSIEEGARELRYQFLFSVAQKRNAKAVLVAHHADDQVETVLMHLLRGAGLAGLKGMRPCTLFLEYSESIPLVRPLLFTWRKEILKYCNEKDLEPTEDFSNFDTRFFRNRLRHDLIPLLESYNPKIREAIFRMVQSLTGDHEVLQIVIKKAWEDCVERRGDGFVAFSQIAFQGQPIGIQRGLLRQVISTLRPRVRDVDFNSIEKGLAVARNPVQSDRIDLISGLFMMTEEDYLWIADWDADLPSSNWPQVRDDKMEVVIPGNYNLGSGWYFKITKAEDADLERVNAFNNEDLFRAWLDADQVRDQIMIRPRISGDRFEPLGMRGHSTKLSDIFINAKIPRRARVAWPLICSADIIHWIPGCNQSHKSRITDQTTAILTLQLEKVNRKK
ncbi:MAG: tRNA lysidine(34) synthetase TilS [Chloroflexi bacterium]|nr:tRNA lysidine(34) synthetase TilS [Chloroflexota bacterium]